MKLKALKTFRNGAVNVRRDGVIEVADARAKELIARGYAMAVDGVAVPVAGGLDKLTVAELRARAESAGIAIAADAKKADIVAALNTQS